jgi:hypothetical protein
MAERRMFAKKIIDSDAFLDLALSTQALYFHLSMRADDDGFINNPKKIMRMVGASQNELENLLSKRFLIAFEGGIVVIKHWRIHNYIQKDRYTPTLYQDLLEKIIVKGNQSYTDDVYAVDTQCIQIVDTGKVSIGKLSKGKVSKESSRNDALDYSCWPQLPSDQTLNDWLDMRKRLKANVSQTVINRYATELSKAVSIGYTVDFCLQECVTRNWRGFECQWLLNSGVGNANTKPVTGQRDTRDRAARAADEAFGSTDTGVLEGSFTRADSYGLIE